MLILSIYIASQYYISTDCIVKFSSDYSQIIYAILYAARNQLKSTSFRNFVKKLATVAHFSLLCSLNINMVKKLHYF